MKTKSLRKDKINVITLGCSKNLVDSEEMITQLQANDYEVGHESADDANIVIVNTCGFIALAKEESINTILEYPNQAVFQIIVDKNEVLIPITDDIIIKVDRENRQIIVRTPDGLLDIYMNS